MGDKYNSCQGQSALGIKWFEYKILSLVQCIVFQKGKHLSDPNLGLIWPTSQIGFYFPIKSIPKLTLCNQSQLPFNKVLFHITPFWNSDLRIHSVVVSLWRCDGGQNIKSIIFILVSQDSWTICGCWIQKHKKI